jgi:hypothetical protein
MDLYVTAAELAARMALDPVTLQTSPVYESAILGAQHEVENMLNTRLQFTETAVTDYFLLDEDANNGVLHGGVFRLFLTRGFVRTDEYTPVVESSDAETVIPSAGTGSAVPATAYQILEQQGVVMVDPLYGSMRIRVTYKAGGQRSHTVPNPAYNPPADPQPGDPPYTVPATLPDYDTIPAYLKEAIVSIAPILFNIGPTTKRAGEAQPIALKAGEHAFRVLSPYLRKRAFVLSPYLHLE